MEIARPMMKFLDLPYPPIISEGKYRNFFFFVMKTLIRAGNAIIFSFNGTINGNVRQKKKSKVFSKKSLMTTFKL